MGPDRPSHDEIDVLSNHGEVELIVEVEAGFRTLNDLRLEELLEPGTHIACWGSIPKLRPGSRNAALTPC